MKTGASNHRLLCAYGYEQRAPDWTTPAGVCVCVHTCRKVITKEKFHTTNTKKKKYTDDKAQKTEVSQKNK